MFDKLIYTDVCSQSNEKIILDSTGVNVVKRMDESIWTVNEAMRIITDPFVELAIINKLDAISLMEISLFHFMAKPILVTTETINMYPAVVKTVDYIDGYCSLIQDNSSFISWYSAWKENKWK